MKSILSLVERRAKSASTAPSRSPLVSRQIVSRLGLAFSLLIALLIAVGVLGIRRMDRVNADLQDIVMGKQWSKLRLSREMVTYSNRNSRITMEVFLLTDKQKKQIDLLLAVRAENARKISTLLAGLDKLGESTEEKRALAAVEEAGNSYSEIYQQAIHLLFDEENREAAMSLMSQQGVPPWRKYQEALDDLVRLQGDQLEQSARQSGMRYAAARRAALFMIVLAVIVAGATGLFVIQRMVREITTRLRKEKEARSAANSSSAGRGLYQRGAFNTDRSGPRVADNAMEFNGGRCLRLVRARNDWEAAGGMRSPMAAA